MERYNHQSFPEEEKREVGRFSPLNFKWTVDPRQHSLPLKTYPDISFSIISIVKSNKIPPAYVNINFLWKNFNQLDDSLKRQVHLSMADRAKKGDFFGSGYSVPKNIEPVGCTIA